LFEIEILSRILAKGIPEEYRELLWKMRTGAFKYLEGNTLYGGYYEALLKAFPGYPNPHFN
jgi:hypothetical protein